MPEYTVKQGDCTSSLANQHGLFWETIWNHPNNAQLKENRKDANILQRGDKIFIPEKEERQEEGATEMLHQFRRKGVPAKLKVRMLVDDEARAITSFSLYVDKVLIREGKTTNDGFIEAGIPPNATKGKIVLTDDQGNKEEYSFDFGTVDPLDSGEGIKGRLFNLGYAVEDLSGAIREFQQKEGLEATGSVDESTKDKLKERFGE